MHVMQLGSNIHHYLKMNSGDSWLGFQKKKKEMADLDIHDFLRKNPLEDLPTQ